MTATPAEKFAFGTGGSVPIECCQACGNSHLKSVAFFGYMPPVNDMRPVGTVAHEQPSYPLGLLFPEF